VSVSGRLCRAGVHAPRVPYEDVRQSLHHGYRVSPGDARCARQLHVRPQQQRNDALHVRTVPLRRVHCPYMGEIFVAPELGFPYAHFCHIKPLGMLGAQYFRFSSFYAKN